MRKMDQKQAETNFTALWLFGGIGLLFLGWDFYRSLEMSVPVDGWLAYLTGPIFAHKVSELIIGGSWFIWGLMRRSEKSGFYPRKFPKSAYIQYLNITSILSLPATILATYAWTVINLGTSALTTDFTPVFFSGGNVFVWTIWLAVFIPAGGVYTLVMGRKAMLLSQEE